MITFIILVCIILIIFLLKYNKKVDHYTDEDWEYETFVIKGLGKSREIDWKTANLRDPVPAEGQPGLYSCVTNYGKGTILKHNSGFSEVHIHNFDEDIYDKTIKIKNIERHDLPFQLISL
jgi:FAD synthase